MAHGYYYDINYMGAPDFYEELGVSPTATRDEIKSAYRRLQRENYPDVIFKPGLHPGDEGYVERTPEREAEVDAKNFHLSYAYDILSDEKKRQWYDRAGRESLPRQIQEVKEMRKREAEMKAENEAREKAEREEAEARREREGQQQGQEGQTGTGQQEEAQDGPQGEQQEGVQDESQEGAQGGPQDEQQEPQEEPPVSLRDGIRRLREQKIAADEALREGTRRYREEPTDEGTRQQGEGAEGATNRERNFAGGYDAAEDDIPDGESAFGPGFQTGERAQQPPRGEPRNDTRGQRPGNRETRQQTDDRLREAIREHRRAAREGRERAEGARSGPENQNGNANRESQG